jgi:outer membrane lipoprotein-sorting protein
MRRIQTLAASITLAVAIGSAGTAFAEGPSAQEILARMDRMNNDFKDQTMVTTMTIVDVDGSKKSYDFIIRQKPDGKGNVRMLLRFTSGEVKGMATLIEDRNHMYVLLPGLKKTRRVAAHGMSQSFAGSDFSNDDMATPDFGKIYDAAIDREDATHWFLKCTPKAGEKVDYGSVQLKVRKATFQEDGREYFDAAGKKLKTFENSASKDFKGKDGTVMPRNTRIVVADARTGHRTELDVRDFRFNEGLSDSLFTQRELEWGN